MSKPLPTTQPDFDMPIGIPPKQDSKMPTSFRLNAEVRAGLTLLRKGPSSRGFHPSELPRLCPSKFYFYEEAIEGLASPDPEVIQRSMKNLRAILDTEHDTSPGRLPARLMPEFHAGDQIHLYQQFRIGERGYLWGGWECPACEARTAPGFMPRIHILDRNGKPTPVAARCLACNGQNYMRKYGQVRWRYLEPWAGLHEWDLEGHCDGILLVPRKKFVAPALLEIKSINEAGYHGRYGEPLPKADHIKQASQYVYAVRQTYPWLSELRHIYFIYVNKNAQREAKEFLVPADMGVVQESQNTMQTVIDAKAAGKAPEHARICESASSVEALKCPMIERCFGVRPPVNFFDPTSFATEELPL